MTNNLFERFYRKIEIKSLFILLEVFISKSLRPSYLQYDKTDRLD